MKPTATMPSPIPSSTMIMSQICPTRLFLHTAQPSMSIRLQGDMLLATSVVSRASQCQSTRSPDPGKRKLRCSGEPTGCTRCIKQSLTCHYSPQKQMGRPRKRQKIDEPGQSDPDAPPSPLNTAIDPALSSEVIERTNFENVCTAPITQHIKRTGMTASSSQASGIRQTVAIASQGSSNASLYDAPRTPPESEIPHVSYPTDVSQWPDFSDMAMLPMLVQDSHEKDAATLLPNTVPSIDMDANPSSLAPLPPVPDCPCLPNVYLTLSTLSTLSAFPVSSHMIDTLDAAHRTTKSVIYCLACPQNFQSGSLNVMFSGTLLNILADHWHRVRKASAEDLRKGFGPQDSSARPRSILEDLEWRTFAHDLVRAHVFGDVPTPRPPSLKASPRQQPPQTQPASSPAVTLMGLIDAMERRQRQWHGLDPATGEFPKRMAGDLFRGHAAGMTLEELQNYEKDTTEHLCLKITAHSRSVMRSLDQPAPTA